MKKLNFNINISRLAVAISAVFILSMWSCMPDVTDSNGSNGENNGSTTEELPEGVKTIALFSGIGGGDLAGLYFSEDGFLTSANGWMLSSLGTTGGITKNEYIPTTNWQPQLYAQLGLGFIGYHQQQGFVSLYISSIALDDQRRPVGVGIFYIPNFTAGEIALDFGETSIEFPQSGGTHTLELQGIKYALYETLATVDWVTVTPKSSSIPFIKDEIDITVSANTGDEQRSGILTIATEGGKTTKIDITQK